MELREPEGKGVQSSNGYHRFEVKVTSHGGWEFHDLENFDENWVFDFLELGFLIFRNWVFRMGTLIFRNWGFFFFCFLVEKYSFLCPLLIV